MRRLTICCLALVGCFAVARSTAVSDEPPMSQADSDEEVGGGRRLGPHHKDARVLPRHLGRRDRVREPGGPTDAAGEGRRHRRVADRGPLDVVPREGHHVRACPTRASASTGYDNVKKAHVSSWVQDPDTALHHCHGPDRRPDRQDHVALRHARRVDDGRTRQARPLHDAQGAPTTSSSSEIWDLGIGETRQGRDDVGPSRGASVANARRTPTQEGDTTWISARSPSAWP